MNPVFSRFQLLCAFAIISAKAIALDTKQPHGLVYGREVASLAFDKGLRNTAQRFGQAIDRFEKAPTEDSLRSMELACREFSSQYDRCLIFLGPVGLAEVKKPSGQLVAAAENSLADPKRTANLGKYQLDLARREFQSCRELISNSISR